MKYKLRIIVPTGVFRESLIDSLTIKLSNGYTTILANHTPLIGAIDYALMHMITNGEEEQFVIHGGILNIKKDEVVIISNLIESIVDIDLNRAKEAKDRAMERIASNNPSIDISRAEYALKRALARIDAVNNNHK